MIRLARYLKPFVPLILLAIALLFVQANCDLALPDYLSRIVNNGIQQGGIENAVPQAIRRCQMERLALFLNAEEQAAVLRDYTLVDANSPDSGSFRPAPQPDWRATCATRCLRRWRLSPASNSTASRPPR